MQMVEFDELIAKADFISLHIPLTESSKHMIDAAMIAKMKDNVRIVDCARGGVIDEECAVRRHPRGQGGRRRAGRL